MNRRTIWITRTEPAASATAARVRALGLEPVAQPLLAVRAIADARLDLSGVAALAFTSANAVTAFAARTAERGLPAFTVGEATAAAAREAGFTDVASAEGDVAALADLLTSRAPHLGGRVVHPVAAQPAGDLAALTADAGIELRAVPIYETVQIPPPDAFVARLPNLDGVLIHSARAAAALADVLARHPAPRLIAYALSAQAARPIQGRLAQLEIAAAPSEAALLALLTAA